MSFYPYMNQTHFFIKIINNARECPLTKSMKTFLIKKVYFNLKAYLFESFVRN